MKATAIAPANIAFIKYWGKEDRNLRLPTNDSISMNLSNLLTTTTVLFDRLFTEDSVLIDNQKNQVSSKRVIEHLDRIRKLAGVKLKAKVVSVNNFPTSRGLSSSASGFAALTLAGSAALGLKLSEKELSALARLGSGSAARSIPSGFVEWKKGDSHANSYASSLYPKNWWKILDIVAVVGMEKKDIPTSEGQKFADDNPFFRTRLQLLPAKITRLKKYLQEKNFTLFAELVEEEALELHAIMLTSRPSLIYFLPQTITIIKEVRSWRSEGVAAYFTLNTGQDVHILCQEKDKETVLERLENLSVKKIIVNYPADGAKSTGAHLF